MLVKHFIGRLNRLQGKSVTGISQEALSVFMLHDYPGNIRELENILEHAFVLCSEGQIEIQCLPEELRGSMNRRSEEKGMNAALQSTEAHVIRDALERNNYNRLAAAAELGIHKSTLFRKIKGLGIRLPDEDGRSHRVRRP
jgi:transcriptional regulator with PAS, ATPase and Fis domain